MKPEILEHLSREPELVPLIAKITLPVVETHNDIYHDLLESIVSQQLSVKAADTIFKRFLALFPEQKPVPELVIAIEQDKLRACGLSNQKASYIKNVAAYWVDNQSHTQDWLQMPDEAIIAQLTQIKGVGKWTVQMILMFRLGRLDVFPIDDLGVRQGMVKLYGLAETGKDLPKRLTEIAENWRPYRSVACRYIWRWKDSL
jgi:DNA-3-methyladenine glycosylase II